jgi:hypothetical protein
MSMCTYVSMFLLLAWMALSSVVVNRPNGCDVRNYKSNSWFWTDFLVNFFTNLQEFLRLLYFQDTSLWLHDDFRRTVHFSILIESVIHFWTVPLTNKKLNVNLSFWILCQQLYRHFMGILYWLNNDRRSSHIQETHVGNSIF